MVNFTELYQELILDHYRRPRNRESLDHVPDEAIHENPSCGDALKLEILYDADGGIERVRFDGHGCAVSIASASMMTEIISGKSREEAYFIIETVLDALRGNNTEEQLEKFGDLSALSGTVRLPMRVKCASLAWHALKKSLADPKRI